MANSNNSQGLLEALDICTVEEIKLSIVSDPASLHIGPKQNEKNNPTRTTNKQTKTLTRQKAK